MHGCILICIFDQTSYVIMEDHTINVVNLCKLIQTIERNLLFAERCRNKEAAAAAANIEMQCTSPGLMLKALSAAATPSVNNIMT
jgi:hypothetical protein